MIGINAKSQVKFRAIQTIARLLLFNLSVSGAVLLVEIQKPCQNWLQTLYNQGLLTQLEFCWAGFSVVVLFSFYNKGLLQFVSEHQNRRSMRG